MEAAEAIPDSFAELRLVPRDAKLDIELYGELVALVALNQRPPARPTGGAGNAGCGGSKPPRIDSTSLGLIAGPIHDLFNPRSLKSMKNCQAGSIP